MTVKEGDRIALYHIIDHSPQGVAHGLQKLGEEVRVDYMTGKFLKSNIRSAENLAKYSPDQPVPTINGEITSLPTSDGKRYNLRYGIGRNATYLIGGKEDLADITRQTAERVDQLANEWQESTPEAS